MSKENDQIWLAGVFESRITPGSSGSPTRYSFVDRRQEMPKAVQTAAGCGEIVPFTSAAGKKTIGLQFTQAEEVKILKRLKPHFKTEVYHYRVEKFLEGARSSR